MVVRLNRDSRAALDELADVLLPEESIQRERRTDIAIAYDGTVSGGGSNTTTVVGGLVMVADDPAPSLGGEMELNGHSITDTAGSISGSGGNWVVTGNITPTGTVDGRDVSADGAKLDGLPATAYSTSVVDSLVAAQVASINARPAGFPMIPGQRVNTFTHGVQLRSDATSNVAMGADQIRSAIIDVPETATFDEIGIRVTAAVAASNVRLGIATYDFTTRAATLVLDAGQVATDVTGDRAITISQVLTAGRYILMAYFSAAVTVSGGLPASGYGYSPSAGSIICTPVQTGSAYSPFGVTEIMNTDGTAALCTWLRVA